MDYNELYHHGVKGMKWGVRRYQNKDGSPTDAGKKRQSQDTPEAAARRKEIAKKVAVGAAATLTIAAAATLYAKNPAVRNVVNSMGKKTVSSLQKGGSKIVDKGKTFVDNRKNGFAKGVKDAVKAYREANPKKSAAQRGMEFTTKTLGRVSDFKKGVTDGINEGVKEAPKKATKAIITGMTMNAAKRALDTAVGKEEAARIFKANNNKKIDSFWKVQVEDKDDD